MSREEARLVIDALEPFLSGFGSGRVFMRDAEEAITNLAAADPHLLEALRDDSPTDCYERLREAGWFHPNPERRK